jgi:hypothetical protein
MNHCKKRLGSATLLIAILVFFFVVILRPALARLFRLVLARLVVLALPMLTRLTTLLALLLHIVSHKTFLLRKAREISGAFGFVANEA